MAALAVGIGTLSAEIGQTWSGIPLFRAGDVGPRVLASPEVYPELRPARPQTRVIAIDGLPMPDGQAISRYIRSQPPGHAARFEFEQWDGQQFTRSITLTRFTADDALMIYGPLMLLGLLFLVVTVTPAFAQPEYPAARAAAIMGMGLAGNFTFLLPDYLIGHRITPYSYIFGVMGLGGLIQMGLTFPRLRPPLKNAPGLTLAALYGGLSIFWIGFANNVGTNMAVVQAFENSEVAILVLGLALLLGNLAISARESHSMRRRQSKMILPAVSLFALAAMLLAASTFGWIDLYLPPAGYLVPVPFVVIALGRAMASADLFELDAFSRQLLSRATFLMGTLTLFSVLIVVFTLFTQATTAWT
ncbi:MAG: hypothetical protein P8M78_18400, partial [Myxococcota bacterium]|nr:hypothetical protein [Myxococcota bacterium]